MTGNQIYRSSDTAVKDGDRISVGETMIGICCLVVLLVLFNLFPERIGVVVSADDPSSFVPLLSPQFFEELLPRLNLWWVLALALHIVNLYAGGWTWGTRLADYALTFFGLFILVKMILTPAVGINLDCLQAGAPMAFVGENLLPLLTWLVRGALVAALIATLASLGRKTRSLIRVQCPSAWAGETARPGR